MIYVRKVVGGKLKKKTLLIYKFLVSLSVGSNVESIPIGSRSLFRLVHSSNLPAIASCCKPVIVYIGMDKGTR